jgi:hypothetical protein
MTDRLAADSNALTAIAEFIYGVRTYLRRAQEGTEENKMYVCVKRMRGIDAPPPAET